MKFDRVFLDMDGTLCDFIKAALSIHNRMDAYETVSYPKMDEGLGMQFDEFWNPVVDAGHEFWAELEPFPWTYELLGYAHTIARDVSILTRPLMVTKDGRDTCLCIRGKVEWLRKHIAADFEDVVFTKKKHVVAHPGAILIDDDEQHEAEFRKHGGEMLILPQHYNRYRHMRYDRMESLRKQFELCGGKYADRDSRSRA